MAHASELASGPVADVVFETAASVYEDASAVLGSIYGEGAVPLLVPGFEGHRFALYPSGHVWRVTELSANLFVAQDLTPGTAKVRARLRLEAERAEFERAVAAAREGKDGG